MLVFGVFYAYICMKRDIIMHENAINRIKKVQELAREYYEPGRLDRCHKEVWRRYVYPVYPISYHTYLNYIHTDVRAASLTMKKACRYIVRTHVVDLFDGQ